MLWLMAHGIVHLVTYFPAGFYERGNELSGSIKCVEFLE